MRLILTAFFMLLCGACGQLPPAGIPPVIPGPARAVVFDIDGTLTPDVFTINTARPDAAEVVQALARKGYQVIYLSARARFLSAGIPGWLRDNGFPDGSIHVAQTREDRKRPATFKAGILEDFKREGWTLSYAYGDSSTDFAAYEAAGIPSERVFALRREGADGCQPGAWRACLDGWEEQLGFVASIPPR